MRCDYNVFRSHQLYSNYAMCHDYSSSGRISFAPTTSCATTTRLSGASTLLQLSRAPRLLMFKLFRLYLDYPVRHDYSSSGHIGSTVTTPCAMTTRLLDASALQLHRGPRLVVFRPHWLYLNYVVRHNYSYCRGQP
jgi:hypothetical protein